MTTIKYQKKPKNDVEEQVLSILKADRWYSLFTTQYMEGVNNGIAKGDSLDELLIEEVDFSMPKVGRSVSSAIRARYQKVANALATFEFREEPHDETSEEAFDSFIYAGDELSFQKLLWSTMSGGKIQEFKVMMSSMPENVFIGFHIKGITKSWIKANFSFVYLSQKESAQAMASYASHVSMVVSNPTTESVRSLQSSLLLAMSAAITLQIGVFRIIMPSLDRFESIGSADTTLINRSDNPDLLVAEASKLSPDQIDRWLEGSELIEPLQKKSPKLRWADDDDADPDDKLPAISLAVSNLTVEEKGSAASMAPRPQDVEDDIAEPTDWLQFMTTIHNPDKLTLTDAGPFVVVSRNYSDSDVPVSVSSMMTPAENQTYTVRLSKDDLKKLPHDIVCTLFSKDKPDVRIPSTTLTPDFEFRSYYLEVGTVIDEERALEAAEEKMRKYARAIRKSDKEMKVLIVSRSKVVTNLELSSTDCQMITNHYNNALHLLATRLATGTNEMKQKIDAMMGSVGDNKEKLMKELGEACITLEMDKQWTEIAEQDMSLESGKIHGYIGDELAKATVQESSVSLMERHIKEVNGMSNTTEINPVVTISFLDPLDILGELRYAEGGHPLVEVNNFMVTQRIKEWNLEDRWVRSKIDPTTKSAGYYGVTSSPKWSDATWAYLRDNGFKGVAKKKEQRFYHLDTTTQDIEAYQSGFQSHLYPNREAWDPLGTIIKPLIDFAKSCALKGVDGSVALVEEFSRSKLGQQLIFLEHVIQNANITMSKLSGKDHISVLPLPFGARMLVRSVKTQCSVIIAYTGTNTLPLCFSQPLKIGDDQWIFEPMTLNEGKITQYLGCFEKVISSLVMWFELFREEANFRTISQNVCDHLFLNLMVYLADKQQLVDQTTQIRYGMMELVAGNMRALSPSSFKILSKFPFYRNRLQVLITRRMMRYFRVMEHKRPKRLIPEEGSENTNLDLWVNLHSWWTGARIDSFEQVCALSYMGVMRNKDEGETAHGYKKIFSKIIKKEMELRDITRPVHIGLADVRRGDKVLAHEFSPSFVIYAARRLRENLEAKYGDLHNRIMSRLIEEAGRPITDLGTFKASAINQDHLPKHLKLTEETKRKAIESLAEELHRSQEFHDSKFSNIGKVIDVVSKNGVFTVLFKKNQISGIREIFILDFQSRRAIHLLETISRIICDMSEVEFLTKGHTKSAVVESHYRTSLGKESITMTNSGDAKTWCQEFVMPVFGAMFKVLLPESLYWVVLRILNSVARKRLRLPNILIDEFFEKPHIDSYDDALKELKSQIFGSAKYTARPDGFPSASAQWLVEFDTRDLLNRSNMMQGILHYTSSLLHVLFATFRRDWFCSMIPSTKRFTAMVSSDDFGDIVTMDSSNATVRNDILQMSTLNRALLSLSPHFCIRVSEEKSTIGGFHNVFEFNSLFYSMGSQIVPSIKFVHSAISLTHKSSTETVLSSAANVLKQVVESGGSIFLAYVVELCQARLFYYSLGGIVNPLFDRYTRVLLDVPHPSLGFFPFQSVPGILGFEQAKWTLWNHPRSLAADAMMRQLRQGDVAGSGVSFSVKFLFGKSRNHKKFVDSISRYYESEVDKFEPGLEWYFRRDLSFQEQMFRIKMQAESVDAIDSLSRNNLAKVMKAAVYRIEYKVITVREDDNVAKDSLISLACRLRDLVPLFNQNESVKRVLFPLNSHYQISYDTTAMLSGKTVTVNESRRVISTVVLAPGRLSYCPLSSVIRYKWMNQPQPQSEEDLERSFKEYQDVYPWLSENGPLPGCPHKTNRSLASFIIGHDKFETSVQVIAPFRARNAVSLLMSCLRRMMYRGKVLVDADSVPIRSLVNNLSDLHDKLVLNSFMADQSAGVVMRAMPIEDVGPDRLQETMDVLEFSDEQRKLITMAAVQKFSNPIYLAKMWKHMRGYSEIYVVPQQKENGEYVGRGSLRVVLPRSNDCITLHLLDSLVTSIELPQNYELRKKACVNAIAKVMRRAGLMPLTKGPGLDLRTGDLAAEGVHMTRMRREPWVLAKPVVTIKNNRFRLFDGAIQVLKSTPSIMGLVGGQPEDSHISAWRNKRPLSLHSARLLLRTPKREKWCKESFMARFDVTPPIVVTESIDDNLDDFSIEADMDITGLMDAIESSDDLITEDLDISDLIKYTEPAVIDRVARGIYASVPYWDMVIRNMMQFDLPKLIRSQTKVESDDDIVNLILSWYGNDEKPKAAESPVEFEYIDPNDPNMW